MPRMIRRAAVLGATAHVASQRGEARAEAAAQQAPVAAAPTTPAQPAPDMAPALTSAPPAPPPNEGKYDELEKLWELLGAGIITQAEYDAKKQQILGA